MRSGMIGFLGAQRPSAGDPYWESVVSLLHFDDGITDDTGRVWASSGSVGVAPDIGKFGGGLNFPTIPAYLQTPPSADFSPSSNGGKLTIEFFVNPDVNDSSQLKYLLCARSGDSLANAWVLERAADGRIGFVFWNSSGTQQPTASSGAGNVVAPGVFTHVAVVVDVSFIRIFLNGTLASTTSITTKPDGASQTVFLGRSPVSSESSRNFVGVIDELRITRWVARYTGNFIPPTEPFPNFGPPPEPDPYWANVVTLLRFDGDFTDETGRLWVAKGNATISSELALFGNTSGKFFGVGSRIDTDPTIDFSFGTGDFTVEGWLYVGPPPGGSVANDRTIFGAFDFNPDMNFFLDRANNAPSLWNGTVARASSLPVPTNSWSHFAFVRESGVLRIFVDGVKGYEGALTTNFGSTAVADIGSDRAASRPLNGYFDSFRVTKGVARYTENFTPPTAPFPNG